MWCLILLVFPIFFAFDSDALAQNEKEQIRVVYAGIGRSFKTKESDIPSFASDKGSEILIWKEILTNPRNKERLKKIRSGIKDFFREFNQNSKKVEVKYFFDKGDWENSDEQIGAESQDIKVLLAFLSFDKIVSFVEKIKINDGIQEKKTIYASFSFYLMNARDKKLVFSRPFIIPFNTIGGDGLEAYRDNIMGGMEAFFTDPGLMKGNLDILENCLSNPASIFSRLAKTYGVVNAALSENAKEMIKQKEEQEKLQSLTAVVLNSFMSYHYLVIPTKEGYRGAEYAKQMEKLEQALDITIRVDLDNPSIGPVLGMENDQFIASVELPEPRFPMAVKVYTARKVLEEKKLFSLIEYKAKTELKIGDDLYKCIDGVEWTQVKSVEETNVQFFNVAVNSISKLKGGLDKCIH